MKRLLEFLSEGMFRKKMVRDQKVITKWKTDRPGTHKIVYDEFGNPHEERMTHEEIKHRELGRKSGKVKNMYDREHRSKEKELSMHKRELTSDLKHYNKQFPDVNSEHDNS